MEVVRLAHAALLLAALGVLGVPSRAHADEPAATAAAQPAAQEAHRHALELFDRKEHAAALAEFKRAYGLSPSFRLLYNIGLTQAALGNSPAAVEAFSQYLQDGGSQIPADRRQKVDAEVQRLAAQLGALTVELEEAGAELSIDSERVGSGALSRKVWLYPGQHVVDVRSPDGKLRTQKLTLARGEHQRLRFQAAVPSRAPSVSTPATGSSSQPGPEAHAAHAPFPWVAWGVTGALGVAAGVTGALALAAHSDQSELKKRAGVTPTELRDARDKVTGRALASDILLAGTAVAAGVSLYLTFRTPGSAERDSALSVGPGGVTLSQRF